MNHLVAEFGRPWGEWVGPTYPGGTETFRVAPTREYSMEYSPEREEYTLVYRRNPVAVVDQDRRVVRWIDPGHWRAIRRFTEEGWIVPTPENLESYLEAALGRTLYGPDKGVVRALGG